MLSHLPVGANVQMFWGADANTYVAWSKPRGCNFIYIHAIGNGCGGAGGKSAAVGSTKGGGGGGGGGGVTSALFLASTIPERLYLRVSQGLGGGTADSDGGVGSTDDVYVLVHPINVAQNKLIHAQGSPIAATAGTGAAGGAGGNGASASTAANCPLINLALAVSFAAGRAGTNGNIATPLDTSIGTTLPILGGAGGGGYTAAGSPSAGGKVAFSGYLPNSPGGTAGGAVGGRGSDGIWLPPYIFGGTGGGGTNDAVSVGGAGGYGVAPGAGGGGGGGGVTGGRGGDGGPGLVVIVSWA